MPLRPEAVSPLLSRSHHRTGGVLGRLAEADLLLFRRTAKMGPPWVREALDAGLPPLTRAADHSLLWLGLAGVIAGVGGRRGRRAAVRGLASLAVASAVTNLPAKLSARRVRPPLHLVPIARRAWRVPTSSSFPSGHSASAAAFATGVALESRVLGAPVAVLAGAVAFSRVYTGVHYPGDVGAGIALGVAAGLGSRRLWPVAPLAPAGARTSVEPATRDPSPTGAGLVVVVNPGGGGDHREAAKVLGEQLPDAEVVVLDEGGDLLAALRDAAARADVLGVGGGDGSAAAGATVALEAGLPLMVLPLGTLDHFARDIGLTGVEDAVEALRAGSAVHVDIGTADLGGGERRLFLNTASIGAYPALVEAREQLQSRIGKWPAVAVALVRVLRTVPALDVEVNGRRTALFLSFVGNGSYHPSGFAPSWRSQLDDGVLDVRLVEQGHPFSRTRLALAVLSGRLGRSRLYSEHDMAKVQLRSLVGPMRLALDGEVLDGGSQEITLSKDDGALVVYRPAP